MCQPLIIRLIIDVNEPTHVCNANEINRNGIQRQHTMITTIDEKKRRIPDIKTQTKCCHSTTKSEHNSRHYYRYTVCVQSQLSYHCAMIRNRRVCECPFMFLLASRSGDIKL